MYDLEIYVGNPYPSDFSGVGKQEASIYYKEEEIRINLTRIWKFSFESYDVFLDWFIGVIVHEFLHYFMHANKIHQTEGIVRKLTHYLHIPSIGHLIGARNRETQEDKMSFQRWMDYHFKDGNTSITHFI